MQTKDYSARLWAAVDARGDCWEWTGKINNKGYGLFYIAGRHRCAHRVVWEFLVGPIAEGLEIDHFCRNHRCVNPDHLEPVTHAENVRRARRGRKTHCKRGHSFDPANTREYRGERICRTCERMRENKRTARSRNR